MPKYEGWFLYYYYIDFVEPTLQRFYHKPTKDPFAHLSNDDIDFPSQIIFSNTPVKRPEKYPREPKPVPPSNPLEPVTFKILNRQFPQFMQRDPQSLHACFYGPGEGRSKVSSWFHRCEDEDVDTSFPWHVPLEDNASIKSAGEASCQEHINQKRKDKAELETMRHWGPRRRMLHEEVARRRSPTPPRGCGVVITRPSFYN